METIGAKVDWQKMAIIEIEEDAGDLYRLVIEPQLNYELRKSNAAPAGYVWLDLHIDSSHGAYRSAQTARAVLNMLKLLASRGVVRNLRIVTGGEWLDIGKKSSSRISSDASLP